MTKRRAFSVGLVLAVVNVAQANPIFHPPPLGESPVAQGAVALAALVFESLVIVRLAGRVDWQRDAKKWFCITVATFLLFIVVPLGIADSEIGKPGDALSGLIALLELAIVVIEAGILWSLWLRKERRSIGASLLRSLGISLLGNLVSYGVSVGGIYALSAISAQ